MLDQTWLQVLYYMTLYPQYLPTLMEEAAQIIGECGWTKDALDRLEKLDSFIRETQRLSPLASGKESVAPTGYLVLILNASVSTQRLALEDFTFSNGVRIPKGTMIQGVATPVHLDPKFYSNPDEFQPFRFFSDDPDVPKKDMATISSEFLPFSYGRNAWCVVHIVFQSLADSDITMFHIIALVGGTRKRSSSRGSLTSCSIMTLKWRKSMKANSRPISTSRLRVCQIHGRRCDSRLEGGLPAIPYGGIAWHRFYLQELAMIVIAELRVYDLIYLIFTT
jgi:Cytochrome P450